MALVADLALAWAADDKDTLEQWLADDFSHDIFGPRPQGEIAEAVVLTALNHGRHAGCDGYIIFADSDSDSDSDIGAARLRFSHFFAFSSTTKTAKVTALRTYLVGEGA